MSDSTTTKRLFLLTEVCGRQLLGKCDDAENAPIEDARGYIHVEHPLMLTTSVVMGPQGASRVTNVNKVCDVGWTDDLRVKASSFTLANRALRDMYDAAYNKIRADFDAACAAASGLVLATDVSEEDIAAARSVERMKVS